MWQPRRGSDLAGSEGAHRLYSLPRLLPSQTIVSLSVSRTALSPLSSSLYICRFENNCFLVSVCALRTFLRFAPYFFSVQIKVRKTIIMAVSRSVLVLLLVAGLVASAVTGDELKQKAAETHGAAKEKAAEVQGTAEENAKSWGEWAKEKLNVASK